MCYPVLMASDQIEMGIFSVDLREFDQVQQTLMAMKGNINAPIAILLNELGFTWRSHIVAFFRQGMIMRNPRFILSRMYVEKTPVKEVARMATRVGSTLTRGKGGAVTFDGFAGKMGIEYGGRSRTMSLLSRGGEKEAKAKASGKLMPDKDFPSPEQWDEAGGPSRALQYMLRDILKNGSATERTVIIPKGYGIAPGLYKIVGRGKRGAYALPSSGRMAPKLQIVQHFDKKPAVHKWMWLPLSMQDIIRRAPIAMMWQAAVDKIIKAKGK
jgi:hypothetical protein